MAQSGYTPILIYASGATGNTPSAANMTSSAAGAELALNYFDGKLFYKDASGNIQVLAGKGGTGVVAGSNTQIQFNDNGTFGASASLTWDGTYLTAGSIKDSALTSGRVTYAGASGLLTDSANLTFNGTDLTVSGAVNAGTINATTLDLTNLEVTNIKAKDGTASITLADSTGVASFSVNPILSGGTANGVAYLNGSKVLTSGSALTFDGTNLSTTGAVFASSIVRGSTFQASNSNGITLSDDVAGGFLSYGYNSGRTNAANHVWYNGITSELMRLTSTGLGIGTPSPTARLTLQESASAPTALNMLNRNSTQKWAVAVDAASVDDKILAFIDQTNSVVRMALDSSGNLGLGVTPSAWSSSGNIQLPANGMLTANGNLYLLGNAYYNANFKYTTSAAASQYAQGGGAHYWYTAPSGTAGAAITFTQAMTLDASGNLAIGTTSASARVHAMGTGTANIPTIIANSNRSGTNAGVFSMYGYNASTVEKEYARLYATIDTNTAGSEAGSMVFQTINAGTLAERARINSSGNLIVGKTTTGINTAGFTATATGMSATNTNAEAANFNRESSDGALVLFRRASTQVGSVSVTTTATTYATSSDYRLKNSIVPMTGALAKVSLLKPCTYKWNADGSDGEGFIAHELQAVVPQCVSGEKDAVDAEGKPVYQGIDTSFLVATLTAAIQELKAEFDAYKAAHP